MKTILREKTEKKFFVLSSFTRRNETRERKSAFVVSAAIYTLLLFTAGKHKNVSFTAFGIIFI